jgi:biotin carboxyl carrier protein
MKYDILIGTEKITIEEADGGFLVNGVKKEVNVEVLEPGVYSLIVDGRSYEVAVRDEKKGFSVEFESHLIPVKIEDPFKPKGAAGVAAGEGEAVITSPMPGRIVGIKVELGQMVKEGDGVILVEAMKMENELHALKSGKVAKIEVKVGDAVEAGQDLVTIE